MSVPKQRIGDWSKLLASLYYCYEGRVPSFGQGRVYNPGYATWLVLEGWGEIREEGAAQATVAQAGEWMFVPSGKRQQTFSPEAKILSIGFFAKYITGHPLVDFSRAFCVCGSEFPKLEVYARRLPLVYSKNGTLADFKNPTVDLFSFFEIQKHLMEWMDVWMRVLLSRGNKIESPLGLDQRVVQAIHLLETHVEDSHITTEYVAKKTGVSISQLNRLFLRDTGLTLNDFRDRQRIDLAIKLLTGAKTPLKEIAYDLGFSYPSHFSTWFHRHQGVSPSHYRKSYFKDKASD
ncbi:AraC family transcriptional regulator [Kiritimatiellaeota bacterium B1221]|nr:AraC family transcriptional regulator [Kiritimatiellaeota bacterium B1221]